MRIDIGFRWETSPHTHFITPAQSIAVPRATRSPWKCALCLVQERPVSNPHLSDSRQISRAHHDSLAVLEQLVSSLNVEVRILLSRE